MSDLLKTCLKCGHRRTDADRAAPPHACPRCGAIYAKVEEARRAKALADTLPAPLDSGPEPTRPLAAEPLRLRVKAPVPVPRPLDRLHRLGAHAIYALMALGLLAPLSLPALLAPLLAAALAQRARRGEPPEWMRVHHTWQLRTFWIGALGTGAALLAAAVLGAFAGGLKLLKASTLLMGYRGSYVVLALVLITAAAYAIRLVRGWAALGQGRPVGPRRQGTGLYGPPVSSARR